MVFFGRTSKGKSTAINALLGQNILPTAKGRTTSCFCILNGEHNLQHQNTSDNRENNQSLGDGYFQMDDEQTKTPIMVCLFLY